MALTDTQLKLESLPAGEAACVPLGEVQVGFFHTAEGLFAINNVCPHRGAPLHEGFVSEGHVTCPWHQWHFRLSDGICSNIPGAKVETYATEVRDGTIWVNLKN